MSLKTSQHGFTLMEIVAAMGIFSIILLITIGAFSRFAVFQRRAIDEQAFQEDVRLAVDLMNREIRTGFGDTYESANGIIAFRNQDYVCVWYRVKNDALERAEDTNDATINSNEKDCLGMNPDDPQVISRALTGADSTIIAVDFRARQAIYNAGKIVEQGYVTVQINAQARQKGNPLVIQTTVASHQTNPYPTI